MSKPSQSSRISLVAVVLIGLVAIAWCCDTPVYRFAMYNWKPTPYEVYFFYTDVVPKDQQAINARLRKLSDADESRLNVSLLPMDVKDDLDLKRTPILPEVRKAWLKDNKQPTNGYLVVGPKGAVLHRGNLTMKQVEGLAASKQRTQLGKQLENGDACVFLLLPGKNAKENDAARKVISRVIADVKSGKINLYQAPRKDGAISPDGLEALADKKSADEKSADKKVDSKSAAGAKGDKKKDETKDKKEKEQPKPQVSMIVIDRASPSEEWFVKNLLSLEDDLKDLSSPMVFPVYGRARALLPMVAKGINYTNLVGAVEFVTGACSCEIKDDNPGVDLLVHYDWESAANKIAEKFGREEGNQNRFAGNDLFPEIIIPPATQNDQGGKDKKGDPQVVRTEVKNELKKQTADNKKGNGKAAQDKDNPSAKQEDKAVAAKDARRGAAADDKNSETSTAPDRVIAKLPTQDVTPAGGANSEQATVSGVLIIGTGIGLALLFLMVATMVIMRPR